MELQSAKTFGHVREIPKDVEETRTIPAVIMTKTRDRHHTVLDPAKCRLGSYRRNPVVGYQHNLYGDLCNKPDPDDIIAQDKGIKLESIDGKPVMIGHPQFEPASLNLNAEKIFRKLILGSLRAFSVGFLEISSGKWGSGAEAQGRDNETYYFSDTELLEYSVVNIPSNPDSVKRAMRDNTKGAIMYCFRELGKKFRLSQIEEMRVCDVLTLLEGRDLEIRETDPKKVLKMLSEKRAKEELNSIIEKQQVELRTNLIFEAQKAEFNRLLKLKI